MSSGNVLPRGSAGASEQERGSRHRSLGLRKAGSSIQNREHGDSWGQSLAIWPEICEKLRENEGVKKTNYLGGLSFYFFIDLS